MWGPCSLLAGSIDSSLERGRATVTDLPRLIVCHLTNLIRCVLSLSPCVLQTWSILFTLVCAGTALYLPYVAYMGLEAVRWSHVDFLVALSTFCKQPILSRHNFNDHRKQ